MNTNLKKKAKNVRFRFYRTQIFIILALNVYFVFGQKKTIVIDPGHGGMDSGAVGINQILEKDIVLKVAKEILKLNRLLFDNRLDIYLTRYGDTFIPLGERSQLAHVLHADVFISLHCNSSKILSRGIEIYVHNTSVQNTNASIGLGVSILNEFNQKLGFKNRGLKFENFQVLRETIFCHAILVEMGFVTNINEAYYFLNPNNIRALGQAILMGIIMNYSNIKL